MKKFLLYIFSAILLTGCLNYEQITTIYGNHSGKMFIHYWTNKIDLTDSTYLTKLKLFDENTIRQEYNSKFVNLNDIEIYTDYSDSTLHAKVNLTFENIDSLKFSKAFRQASISIKDLPDGNQLFSQAINSYFFGFGIEPSEYKMKYVYYLPGKIINHNGNYSSNNKVVWEFRMDQIDKIKTLSATFKPYPLKETPKIIYYLAGFVLLVVFVFIFRKRKG